MNASTGTNPVSSTSYNASGQVTGVTFGSLDAAAFSFDNNSGRMTQYKETINGSATFGTIGWNANGTPSSLAITDPFNAANGGKTCTFGYDDLIRVSSTSCTGSVWSQTFTYDSFGNITKSGSSSWVPGYNSATNRYTLGGTSYDANGNLLNDTFHIYTWNSDGQVLSVDSTGLTYDALGHQVERTNGAGYVQYVYAGSTKLALMNGQTLTRAFVPLPGGTQGVYTTSFSKYRVPDWQGTFRIESTSGRAWSWSGAFAPFGERYAESGSAAAKTFAGNNWDTVSDLYDAQFREDHGGQGRWISPDPAGVSAVDLTDPQTWNRYAYVRNSPLNLVDPFGLDMGIPCGNGSRCGGGRGGNSPDIGYGAGDDDCFITVDGGAVPCGFVNSESDVQCLNNDCSPVPIAGAGFARASYGVDDSISWSFSFEGTYKGVVLTDAALAEALVLWQRGPAFMSTYGGMWEMDYRIGRCKGDRCTEDPNHDKYVVSLFERQGNGTWKSGGKQRGGFDDYLSSDSRTITQQWSLNGDRVQVVLGFDSHGGFVTARDVRVVIQYPNPPVYSPIP